ncbi:hypothetical protein I546_5126 [Mycobacterium kansasii 732]|nr:hypothetical protein I546_5126 [Mycobacterium kansasii 732]
MLTGQCQALVTISPRPMTADPYHLAALDRRLETEATTP